MALATAAQVRAEAPGLFDATADDARLGILIARADAAFARWCHHPRPDSGPQTMEAATYTVFPDRYAVGLGPDARRLVLPTPPVLSVTSVHVDPEQDYDGSTLLGSGEYLADGRALELTIDADTLWSIAPRANRVVCSAGYVVDDHPVLTEACIFQVVHWGRNSAAAGERSSSAGQSGSRTVDRLGLLEEVREMLHDYRLVGP